MKNRQRAAESRGLPTTQNMKEPCQRLTKDDLQGSLFLLINFKLKSIGWIHYNHLVDSLFNEKFYNKGGGTVEKKGSKSNNLPLKPPESFSSSSLSRLGFACFLLDIFPKWRFINNSYSSSCWRVSLPP